jgi:hypothetical protein
MGHKIGDRRSFVIIASSVSSFNRKGRYLAKYPFAAGRKAATQLFKETDDTEIRFIIRESTSSSDKDAFFYEAKKVKLDKPRKVTLKDKTTGVSASYDVTHDVKLKELDPAHASDLIEKAGIAHPNEKGSKDKKSVTKPAPNTTNSTSSSNANATNSAPTSNAPATINTNVSTNLNTAAAIAPQLPAFAPRTPQAGGRRV